MTGRRMHSLDTVQHYRDLGAWTDETAQQLFAARVAEGGDRLAVVDPPNKPALMDAQVLRLTWAQLAERVERLAKVLLDNGIGESDVLCVQLPNSVELVEVYLAGWRIGAIISPLPVQYREHEIAVMGQLAGIKGFLTATRILDRRVADIVHRLRGEIDSLEVILAYGPDPGEGVVGLDDALQAVVDTRAVGEYERDHPVDPNDCLTICWTSGTENSPKGVPRAHYEWMCISRDTTLAPQVNPSDVLLNPFPMVNMGGLAGMFLPWLRTGCVLVQHHPFDLVTFLSQIQSEKVTYTVAPPALLALLLHREELLARADISTLRLIGSGSAPLQEWMVKGWHTRHGLGVVNFFGSNEGIALMTDLEAMSDPGDRAHFFPRYGGGRHWSFPVSEWTSVVLADPLTGKEIITPGTPGELRIKGPTLFAGYLPSTTTHQPFDEHGYFCTGDVFAIAGAEGQYLEHVDRAGDLVIRGGTNIAPAELETLIATHPSVAEVAVVGYPDDVMGERVCAVVACKPGASLTLPELTEHLQAHRIASFKLPERLELREALPRNPMGKILKRQLRLELA